jgi:hypothetical protein
VNRLSAKKEIFTDDERRVEPNLAMARAVHAAAEGIPERNSCSKNWRFVGKKPG